MSSHVSKTETHVDVTPSEIERARKSLKIGTDDTRVDLIEINAEYVEEVCQLVEKTSGNCRTGSRSTIYRVPPEILSHNGHAYRPKVVCIGPYFYSSRNDKDLNSMQDHKWICVNKLTSKRGETKSLVEKCLKKMKELEGRVRMSYSEDISWLKSKELALMMMLDGCFILHLLLKDSAGSEQRGEEFNEDDRKVIGRLWIWNLVKYDLLLLENQIPFFVVQNLYEILKTRDNEGINPVECALRYFSNLDPCRKGQSLESFRAPAADDVHHLLHLIYQSNLPCPDLIESSTEPKSLQWIPCTTKLQAAGVKFKERKNASSFLDIKFSNGVMEIPYLEVHDYSDSLFRNLIAFEQCYPLSKFCVTVYAVFMDCLVNTQMDLSLLHLNGILTSRMTDDKDIIHFFSRLCNEVHYSADKNYLDGVFRDVTKYKDSNGPKWRAALVRDYFSNPWAIISVVAGTCLLLLTFIQAFFACWSYFRPSK